jgi:ubiquinone/menaquinone biosynthesis C-methylase UbiE
VTCLDVSRKSLDVGAARHGSAAEFQHFDGHRIPYPDGTFDAALASCVFHHIPHDEHVELLGEIRRVLAPGGRLFVFEHNPLNPLTRHAVNTCEFDEHAKLVPAGTMRRRARKAGFADADIRYRIFFPHALRRLRPLEAAMTWLPIGAQYYVAARKAS